MIPVGKVVPLKQPSLGNAVAVAGKPIGPIRPMMHRNGRPPTMESRKNHPLFQQPAISRALPASAGTGPSSNQLGAYLKALRGGR